MGEFRVVRNTDRFTDACHFYGEVLSWPLTKQWDEPSKGRIFGYGDAARVELLDDRRRLPRADVGRVRLDRGRRHRGGARRRSPPTMSRSPSRSADQPWGHRNFGVTDPTGTAARLLRGDRMIVTPEQIDAYQRDGVTVLRDVVDRDAARRARRRRRRQHGRARGMGQRLHAAGRRGTVLRRLRQLATHRRLPQRRHRVGAARGSPPP